MLTTAEVSRNSTPGDGSLTEWSLTERPLAVYVHYPWCLQKCPYCDFASYATARETAPQAPYADEILRELELRLSGLQGRQLTSVFFGGGTPSLWDPAELGRTLRAIRGAFSRVEDDLEITVECNPTSLDEDRARRLVDEGVGRVSIGVQSLDPKRLSFLGRLHGPEGGLRAIDDARRAGMPRVSGDLIFGVAGGAPQRPEDAAREAGRIADAGATHVSAYALTVEPGTRFGELARRGELPIAEEDDVADAFEAVESALAARGLGHYEVSNYAAPGEESRHNLAYWRGWDYLGLGVSAVGTLSTEGGSALRYKNAVQPAKWSAGIASGTPAEQSREDLGAEDRMRERIMLGLRLAEGVDLAAAGEELGVDPLPSERRRTLEQMLGDGRLERLEGEGLRVRVPRAKWVLADGIAARLF
jgi:putative oxygen-independent coproporphyrinogen III oxidase